MTYFGYVLESSEERKIKIITLVNINFYASDHNHMEIRAEDIVKSREILVPF